MSDAVDQDSFQIVSKWSYSPSVSQEPEWINLAGGVSAADITDLEQGRDSHDRPVVVHRNCELSTGPLHLIFVDGEYVDTIQYGLLRRE